MGSGRRIQLAAAFAAIATFLGAETVFGQAYKCKDTKGRVTYSDAPCLGQDTSTVNTTGNTVDGSADRARASRSEEANLGSRGSQASSGMTDQQRQDRIRELEIESKRMGNSPQQRTAAKREIEALKRGSATQLTPAETEKREDLYKDAGRTDPSTRQRAARELKEQTDRYESPEYLREQEVKRQQARDRVSNISSCDAAGCVDTQGRRYNKGAGSTYFRSDGKACQQVGQQLHCN